MDLVSLASALRPDCRQGITTSPPSELPAWLNAYGSIAQALFVLLAFFFAWRQVHLFKSNNRYKATIDLLAKYDDKVDQQMQELTYNESINLNINRLMALAEKAVSNNDRNTVVTALFAVFNFLGESQSLYDHMIIDRRFYLQQMDEICIEGFIYLDRLRQRVSGYDIDEIRPLAIKAHKHYINNKRGHKRSDLCTYNIEHSSWAL